MSKIKIKFPSQEFLLEGVLGLPQGKTPCAAVVVCHPHPLYGGNMDNSVVEAVCAQLEEQGVAWLKFNFRGVGQSTGSFAQGKGEKQDAHAAINFLQTQRDVDQERMGICGYSFGSMVAWRVAAEDPRIKAVAGISPFFDHPAILEQYERPKLIVCGTEDEFIRPESLKSFFQKLLEPKELIFYRGVDHFWSRQEDEMARRVAEFFKRYL